MRWDSHPKRGIRDVTGGHCAGTQRCVTTHRNAGVDRRIGTHQAFRRDPTSATPDAIGLNGHEITYHAVMRNLYTWIQNSASLNRRPRSYRCFGKDNGVGCQV